MVDFENKCMQPESIFVYCLQERRIALSRNPNSRKNTSMLMSIQFTFASRKLEVPNRAEQMTAKLGKGNFYES